jgi:DMSO/TMAO reductase YedYZ molybdopterin-dependent catalytic subunit
MPGAQWELGAVGNAEWTGVKLSVLLESAGLADDVCDIILGGADRGVPKEEPKPPGPISYARSISKARAIEPDVLIAYQMNGRDLTPEHGYPMRVIVPGHYGMASVKWLTRIIAVTQPFQGYWQTSDYAYWEDAAAGPIRRPLAEMKLKRSHAPVCTRGSTPIVPTRFSELPGQGALMSPRSGSALTEARPGFRATSSTR